MTKVIGLASPFPVEQQAEVLSCLQTEMHRLGPPPSLFEALRALRGRQAVGSDVTASDCWTLSVCGFLAFGSPLLKVLLALGADVSGSEPLWEGERPSPALR